MIAAIIVRGAETVSRCLSRAKGLFVAGTNPSHSMRSYAGSTTLHYGFDSTSMRSLSYFSIFHFASAAAPYIAVACSVIIYVLGRLSMALLLHRTLAPPLLLLESVLCVTIMWNVLGWQFLQLLSTLWELSWSSIVVFVAAVIAADVVISLLARIKCWVFLFDPILITHWISLGYQKYRSHQQSIHLRINTKNQM